MSNEVFEKIKRLPIDKQQEIEGFINFLVGKYLTQSDNIEALASKRRLNMGCLHGQIHIEKQTPLPPHVAASIKKGFAQYENGNLISLDEFKGNHFSEK